MLTLEIIQSVSSVDVLHFNHIFNVDLINMILSNIKIIINNSWLYIISTL